MNHQNVIGPQMRKIRTRSGLTQDELTTRCNVLGWDISRGTLSKIEAQIRRVNDAELLIVSMALKCPIETLYQVSIDDLLATVRQGMSE